MFPATLRDLLSLCWYLLTTPAPKPAKRSRVCPLCGGER